MIFVISKALVYAVNRILNSPVELVDWKLHSTRRADKAERRLAARTDGQSEHFVARIEGFDLVVQVAPFGRGIQQFVIHAFRHAVILVTAAVFEAYFQNRMFITNGEQV